MCNGIFHIVAYCWYAIFKLFFLQNYMAVFAEGVWFDRTQKIHIWQTFYWIWLFAVQNYSTRRNHLSPDYLLSPFMFAPSVPARISTRSPASIVTHEDNKHTYVWQVVEYVRDDLDGRCRGVDVGVADHELLQDVILDGSRNVLLLDPLQCTQTHRQRS